MTQPYQTHGHTFIGKLLKKRGKKSQAASRADAQTTNHTFLALFFKCMSRSSQLNLGFQGYISKQETIWHKTKSELQREQCRSARCQAGTAGVQEPVSFGIYPN